MKTHFTLPVLFLLLSFFSQAQITSSSQWTWVKGANASNQPGVYGTQGVSDPANTPGARGGGAGFWTDATGNFWLFGGYDPSNKWLSDLWKYNVATNQWAWVKGPTSTNEFGVYGSRGTGDIANAPGARYLSTTWKDAAGKFWLFGGYGFAASKTSDYVNLNDLWQYDPLTNTWTWVHGANTNNQEGVYGIMGTSDAANTPGARYSCTEWADAAGNLWLFGGVIYTAGVTQYFNDLWKFNTATKEWTWVSGMNAPNQQATYGTLGVPAAANKPGARGSGVNWTDNEGNFWMFAGYGYASNSGINGYLNDLWKYNPVSNQWTWVKGANTTSQQGTYGTMGTPNADNKPGARAPSASWMDGTGNFWVLGGANGSALGFLNDLWKLSVAGTLPITFNSVKAYQQNANVVLEWKVENETGIKQYEVERSADGIIFSKGGIVEATGNSTGTTGYNWLDRNAVTGNNFYRIRSTAVSGEIKYTQVVKVTLGKGKSGYEIYPNPVVNNNIQLQFINQAKGTYYVQLFNQHGQMLTNNIIAREAGSSTEVIQLKNLVTRGNYTLVIINPNKSRQSIQVTY